MNIEAVVIFIGAFATMISTVVSVVMSNRNTIYRIEQLEKKVDKHNDVIERVAILEKENDEQWKRIDDLRDDVKAIRSAVTTK